MNIKTMLKTWKLVFSQWKYFSVFLVVAFLFYSGNILISSWNTLYNIYPLFGFFGTMKFFFTLFIGFGQTIKLHSFVSLTLISLLLGMMVSLIFFKVNIGSSGIDKKIGLFGGIGLFLAAFAPGCVACGVGLASVLGIGAGLLTFLPYEGLELSILSVGLLSFSVVKITNDLYVCTRSKFSLRKILNSKKSKSQSMNFGKELMKGGKKNE